MRINYRYYLNIVIATLLFLFSIFLFSAHAGTYYYAGVTRTGEVMETSADFTMYQHPSCLRTVCHSLLWQVLWDTKYSNQYVEAGIGYSPRFTGCTGTTSVGLWYASPLYSTGEYVACVPKNTLVHIVSKKDPTSPYVHVTYEYFYKKQRKINISVYTPGWYNTPGIHPTKLEVYSKYSNFPSPVNISIQNISFYFPQDQNVILQHTPPYIAQQIDNTYGFIVQY